VGKRILSFNWKRGSKMREHVGLIGTVITILALGLVCLVLWQTGVIYRARMEVSADLLEAGPPGQIQDNVAGKPVERRQLPVPDDGKKAQAQGGQTAPAPQPDSPSSVNAGTGPASNPDKPPEAGPQTEKPVPVPQVGKGDRRYPGQEQAAQPANDPDRPGHAGAEKKEGYPGNQKADRPVVIRLGFDPYQDQEMDIALVHAGDRIAVNVRPAGRAGCRFYFTFGSGTLETKDYLEWSAGSRRAPAAPVWDGSRITLTGSDNFVASVLGNLNSKSGAILRLGADCALCRWGYFPRGDWGGYEIEIRIYRGNRWNIRPKRLL